MNNYAQEIKHFRNIEDHEKTVSCWAPFQSLHINKHGWCRPCPFSFHDLRPNDTYVKDSGDGNLLITSHNNNVLIHGKPLKDQNWSINNSLLDIWNNDVIERMKDIHMTGNIDPVLCKYCNNSVKEGKPPSSLDFDWVGGKRNVNHEYPQEIELELSNKCNYMCNACSPWCSSKHMERMGLQNDPEYKSIFDDSKIIAAFVEDLRSIIHHVYRINFTGGEPFAQRPVYEILKMINEENPKDLNIHFTTNGSVMNSMVKKLAARPNTHFTISLDSINPKTYPLIRVNGELDNVISNIDTIQSLCTGIIGCSFVVQKDNVFELPKIVSWCNKKGIEFTYHLMVPMDNTELGKLDSITVEIQPVDYLNKLREYLLSSEIYTENNDLCKKNIKMYNQYIERLK